MYFICCSFAVVYCVLRVTLYQTYLSRVRDGMRAVRVNINEEDKPFQTIFNFERNDFEVLCCCNKHFPATLTTSCHTHTPQPVGLLSHRTNSTFACLTVVRNMRRANAKTVSFSATHSLTLYLSLLFVHMPCICR